MASRRRRSVRSSPSKSPENSSLSSSSTTHIFQTIDDLGLHSEEDTCPACNNNTKTELNQFDKESWIRCDSCKTWYHWRCVGNGDVNTIDKWFCRNCLKLDPSLIVTQKAPVRKSSRKRTKRDYANLNSGLETDSNRWLRMMDGKDIKVDNFKRMRGREISLEWLETDEHAMYEPVLIENPEGLGMKMPSKEFTVDDVTEMLGIDTPIEVIDVATQSTSPGWTLGKWTEYFHLDPSSRDKIWNVISLEVSGTKLSDIILPPRLIRDLDWVEKYWPSTRKGKGHVYPKVQLYCLMGVAKAWTDWHIDFAGSSVYYHIVQGSKIFYFIRPTPANLRAYERWSGTEMQNHTWLGDMVDEVVRVELVEGNTMIIPTGWIHAVYTPMDTLVFGGNFLHSYNVSTQLKIRDIEIATQVPRKFRFPMFPKLCWYVGDKFLRDLKAKEEFPQRVLESMEALAEFLVSEARVMERGTEPGKREAKDQVPIDRVKDPSAISRELRWRVRLAAGCLSDDERWIHGKGKDAIHAIHSVNGGYKRKRTNPEMMKDQGVISNFKNFKPRVWERVMKKVEECGERQAKVTKPVDSNDWTERWGNWDGNTSDEDGEMVGVSSKREVIVKVRKTADGLERQRVERELEKWVWS